MSTYTPIASVSITSAVSTVTISGIPQNYTDLIVVHAGKNATSAAGLQVEINGDTTSSNYSYTYMYGDGTSAVSNRYTSAQSLGASYLTETNNMFNFMNYSNITTYKTTLCRTNNAGTIVQAAATLWRKTQAITSLRFFVGAGNFDVGTTFNLYGIAAGSPKAYGGDTVTTDGTYYYHTFLSSGTFTPTQNLTADYLVVAGGGAGGNSVDGVISSGGGGAGGMRCTVTATGGGGTLENALTYTSNAVYTITVGAGGAGSSGGSSGSNSSISGTGITTVTSTGGGRGGGNDNAAANGGSGGGGGNTSAKSAAGTGTANQGYNGGTGYVYPGFPPYCGGGGGGAGQAGNTNGAGYGGNGVATSISGSSVTYAGGGGGGGSGSGTGGSGGGGAAGNDPTGVPGSATANSGSGGGGSQKTNNGGNGGSGIIIIRYPV